MAYVFALVLTVLTLLVCNKAGGELSYLDKPVQPNITASQRPSDLGCATKDEKSPREFAGRIMDITGKDCYLQVGNGAPQQLHPEKKKVSEVFVGDKLKCFGDSSLSLELTGEVKKKGATFDLTASSACFVVPLTSLPRKDGLGPAVRRGGLPAGPQRGDSAICWPPDKGWLKPNELFFRWIPDAVGSLVSLTLYDENRRDIWSADNVKGRGGELMAKEAQQTVSAYRDRGGSNPLTLAMEDSKGRRNLIRFYVLSNAEEKDLESALMSCNQKSKGIMSSLCRANAFRERKLYRDRAAEYDNALKLAPESEALLLMSAEAHKLGSTQCPE